MMPPCNVICLWLPMLIYCSSLASHTRTHTHIHTCTIYLCPCKRKENKDTDVLDAVQNIHRVIDQWSWSSQQQFLAE